MGDERFSLREIEETLGVPCELLDQLVRHGVVQPAGLEGRLQVTAVEVDRIRVACHLVEGMGVQVEDVDVVLHLRERLMQTQRQVDHLLQLVRHLLDSE